MNIRLFFGFVAGTGLAVAAPPVEAVFDFMQIEQVIGGVNGDTSAQAVQLRMRAGLQCFVSGAKLWVHDAAGQNPVLLIDFQSDVAGCAGGDRVLITSANFAGFLDGPLAPDFNFTSPIPDSYLAAGSITLEDNLGLFVYWRLSWGGDDYTGPNDGSYINDDSQYPAPGDFGPPWPASPGTDPLPSAGLQALQFQGPHTALSTTNADDYDLTAGAAVFTNSSGQSGTVTLPGPGDTNGDATVNVLDLIDLLLAFGTACP